GGVARHTIHRAATAPGVSYTGNTRKRRGAARWPRPATAAPCWERPRRPEPWRGYPSPRPGRLGHGHTALPRPVGHERWCHDARESSRRRRYSGIAAMDHHSDARWHGDSPTPTSPGSHSPYGDKSASRCRWPGGVGGSGALKRVVAEAVAWEA